MFCHCVGGLHGLHCHLLENSLDSMALALKQSISRKNVEVLKHKKRSSYNSKNKVSYSTEKCKCKVLYFCHHSYV